MQTQTVTEKRRTAKFYRDILKSGSIHRAIEVLPEVIKKWGYDGRIRIDTEFNWNHRIEGFFIGKHGTSKGRLYADIYWQGDSTDGDTSALVSDMVWGLVIPAEWDNIGGDIGMVQRHSPLRIEREELENAIKSVAAYLSPEAIKARKESDRRSALARQIFAFIDTMRKPKDVEFWNGRRAVQLLLERQPDLYNKTLDELKPIVQKVWEQNDYSNWELRNRSRSGEIVYNLNY